MRENTSECLDRGRSENRVIAEKKDRDKGLGSGTNEVKKTREKPSLLAKMSDLKRVDVGDCPKILWVCKDIFSSTNDLHIDLPSSIVYLLQDFENVFPDEIPDG